LNFLALHLLAHRRDRSTPRTPFVAAGYAAGGAEDAHPSERFAVAPMMDYTTRHFRFLMRLLTRRAVLYTEMVPANTLVFRPDGCEERLGFTDTPWMPPPHLTLNPPGGGISGVTEHPIVLQLGGADPDIMHKAAALAAPYDYDAINLNCGCPSEGVADKGSFGAALMRRPDLVEDLVLAIRSGVGGAVQPGTPVTVKCRLGVDNDFADVEATYENLTCFVDKLSNGPAQVRRFQVHARKAVLGKKVTPKDNRKVPLRYEWVARLAADFPDVAFVLNGGVKTLPEVKEVLDPAGSLRGARGVMCGRAVIDNPWQFATVDQEIFGESSPVPPLSRRDLLQVYGAYCDHQEEVNPGGWLSGRRALLKPLQNLFFGEHYGRRWPVALDEVGVSRPERKVSKVLSEIVAMGFLTAEALDRPPGHPRPPLAEVLRPPDSPPDRL